MDTFEVRLVMMETSTTSKCRSDHLRVELATSRLTTLVTM